MISVPMTRERVARRHGKRWGSLAGGISTPRGILETDGHRLQGVRFLISIDLRPPSKSEVLNHRHPVPGTLPERSITCLFPADRYMAGPRSTAGRTIQTAPTGHETAREAFADAPPASAHFSKRLKNLSRPDFSSFWMLSISPASSQTPSHPEQRSTLIPL
jgi:hypothetical protein